MRRMLAERVEGPIDDEATLLPESERQANRQVMEAVDSSLIDANGYGIQEFFGGDFPTVEI